MVKLEDRASPVAAKDARAAPENERSPHDRDDAQPQNDGSEEPESGGNKGPARKSLIRRHPLLSVIAAAGFAAALIAVYIWWTDSSRYESTDDAFIQARFFTVSPKVSGYVTSVPVTDNQVVEAGATLSVIDDRDYRTALAQAEAQLAQAQASIPNIEAQIAGQQEQIIQAQTQIADSEAALKFAQQQNSRAQDLVKTGAGTVQSAQQNESQLLQAQASADRTKAGLVAAQKQLAALQAQRKSSEASIAQASAQRDQANLNLSYTVVKAAQAGRVTQLTAAKGQFTQAGQSLMVIVPDPLWVVANYRETQISGMKPGQPVDIAVDAYPNHKFKGHLDSIQSGSGTVFSLLPAENATGNYVKVVQRVPVKIVFDEKPDVVLGPGMSVVPWVHVR